MAAYVCACVRVARRSSRLDGERLRERTGETWGKSLDFPR